MKEPKGILLAIWIGLLSSLAGAVNVTTLWLVATPSTHMTGNLSQLVLALVRGEGEVASRLALTLLAFIAVSILSGLLFSDKAFRLGNRYGVLLISFGLLLGLSYVLNWQASWLYLLAFGMGTQNGMFIYYRGMISRRAPDLYLAHSFDYQHDFGLGSGLSGDGELLLYPPPLSSSSLSKIPLYPIGYKGIFYVVKKKLRLCLSFLLLVELFSVL